MERESAIMTILVKLTDCRHHDRSTGNVHQIRPARKMPIGVEGLFLGTSRTTATLLQNKRVLAISGPTWGENQSRGRISEVSPKFLIHRQELSFSECSRYFFQQS